MHECVPNKSQIHDKFKFTVGGQRSECSPQVGGRGFDHRPRHTKDVIKTVPDTSLLSAQNIRNDLDSLSSQTIKKNEMVSIWNERSRVVNIGMTCFESTFK